MTDKMQLCFLLMVAGLGVALAQSWDDDHKLWGGIICPGKYNNFTTVTRTAATAMLGRDICGPRFDLMNYDPTTVASLMPLTATVNWKCPAMENQVAESMTTINEAANLKASLFDFQVTLPDITNKQEYCLMKVQVVRTDGSQVFKTKPIPVVVVPDFSNSEMAVMGTVPEGEVVVSGGNLGDAMAGNSFRATFQNLKQLDNDAQYFAVAFLRPHGHPVVTKRECTELSVNEDAKDLFPYPELSDIPVASHSFSSEDVSPIDLTSKLPNGLEGICGKFELVFLVDAMMTVYPDMSRCDNYQHLTVNFQCGPGEMTPPRCQMVTNAFDPKMVAFLMKGVNIDENANMAPYRRLYEPTLGPWGASWKESQDWADSSHMIKMRGYFLLNVIWQHIVTQKTDECATATDIEASLKEIDGVDPTVMFTDLVQADFMTEYNSYQTADSATLMSRVMELETSMPATLSEKIQKAIKMAILKYLKEDMAPKTAATPEEHKPAMMGRKLEELVRKLFSMDPEMYDDQHRADIAGNLTSVMTHLKKKYVTNTCFNKVYEALIELLLVDRMSLTEDTPLEDKFLGLFDAKKVAMFKKAHDLTALTFWNASRLMVSSCIKRIDGYIGSMCDMPEEPTDMLKKKVCLLKHYHTFIKEKAAGLGLSNIRRDLLKDRRVQAVKERHNDWWEMDISNPLMVQAGGIQPWMENEGDFDVYTVSPDYRKVCKRKMATCLCPYCEDHMDDKMEGTKDGSMDGTKDGTKAGTVDGSVTPPPPPARK